jgi:metal-dependent amidase/aminoacylase/carboxypeptidase family protein
MAEAKPGAYVWMGSMVPRQVPPLHHPHYDFNHDALARGVAYWVNVVKAFGVARRVSVRAGT